MSALTVMVRVSGCTWSHPARRWRSYPPTMLALLTLGLAIRTAVATVYRVDDSLGLGRRFDGVGAISGGGATSKLLVNYDETIRNQILDYLFKPNFGASLHILKVEIGGDSQSTDGSESSHMHTADDENYDRGYEWWLMKEAKKRNPSIKLYGLPWVFPGWLGGSTFNPYSQRSELVRYMVNWVQGARHHHGLDIDYIGIWNERKYDVPYIKMLRSGLNEAGFPRVQIVVTDAEWGILKDLVSDPELQSVSGPIGIHYPGSVSPLMALTVDLPLWASEEYSARNNLAGGGCWARVLSESYVNGYLTAVIAWNLVTGYYNNLPYPRSSLMVANEPWSGHYDVSSPIWMTAHFTQFTAPGWRYLLHGRGVGLLRYNGSYVSLASPDGKDLTIVLESMSPAYSPCFYPMPHYNIRDQDVQLELKGSYASVRELYVWHSYLDFSGNSTVLFHQGEALQVVNGAVHLTLRVNSIYTLTTLRTGSKGSHPLPPPTAPFPGSYQENFEKYPEHAEAFNFAQQSGAFEVVSSGDVTHGKVLDQMVPRPPVDTCRPKRMPRPINLIGDYKWADVDVQYEFYLNRPPEGARGVFLAARVDRGGCNTMYSNGLYLWVLPQQHTIILSANHSRSLEYVRTRVDVTYEAWHTLRLVVRNQIVQGHLDKSKLIDVHIASMPSRSGFVALGTENFAKASFDNFKVQHLTNIRGKWEERQKTEKYDISDGFDEQETQYGKHFKDTKEKNLNLDKSDSFDVEGRRVEDEDIYKFIM